MMCAGDCNCYPRTSVLDLFHSKKTVNICAPMVRYSKLPFRLLVRKYGCDVAYTPMIISGSFNASNKARDSDFTTSADDRPLIVQFAADTPMDFAYSAELVHRYSDGVDLNCGCPQRWCLQKGYGACMLTKPEIVCDMIRQVKSRIPDSNFSVSLKVRVHDDDRKTVEFSRRAEAAGASYITVHGRTKQQRNEPVNLAVVKLVKDSVSIPVVGNGDIFHLSDVTKFKEKTSIDGVMAARGILRNPTLFTGTDFTPPYCVTDFIKLSVAFGNTFTNIHHHLMYMLEKVMPRHERKFFNSYTSLSSVLDHLNFPTYRPPKITRF